MHYGITQQQTEYLEGVRSFVASSALAGCSRISMSIVTLPHNCVRVVRVATAGLMYMLTSY
jgi:hypothetical protein